MSKYLIQDALGRIDSAEQQLREIKFALAQAKRDLAEAERSALIDEPMDDGSVIAFDLKHPPSRKVYSYAAIRAGGRWFTTGITCPARGFTWRNS